MEAESTTPSARTTSHTTDPTYARLRAAWAVRLPPGDAVEELALEGLVVAQWKRARLDALEVRLLDALLDGERPDDLPSLDTICRYAARLAKDQEVFREQLQRLRRERPDRPPARTVEEPVEPFRPSEPPATDRHDAPESLAGAAAPRDEPASEQPDWHVEPEALVATRPSPGAALIESVVAEFLADLARGAPRGSSNRPKRTPAPDEVAPLAA
jgi:hypothetical protein